MNSIHINEYYAQERINARLQEAENHRLARLAEDKSSSGFVIGATASRVYNKVGQLVVRTVHSLEALGKARPAFFHR